MERTMPGLFANAAPAASSRGVDIQPIEETSSYTAPPAWTPVLFYDGVTESPGAGHITSWNACEATIEAPATTRTLLRWEDEVSIEVSYGTYERDANVEGLMVQGRVSRVESTQRGYRLTIRFASTDIHMKRLRRHMLGDQSPEALRLVN
jgi:hypothetical protein